MNKIFNPMYMIQRDAMDLNHVPTPKYYKGKVISKKKVSYKVTFETRVYCNCHPETCPHMESNSYETTKQNKVVELPTKLRGKYKKGDKINFVLKKGKLKEYV